MSQYRKLTGDLVYRSGFSWNLERKSIKSFIASASNLNRVGLVKNEDGAKMVAGRVDTKPAEAIP